jgi:hypothetical protein
MSVGESDEEMNQDSFVGTASGAQDTDANSDADNDGAGMTDGHGILRGRFFAPRESAQPTCVASKQNFAGY